MGALRTAKRKLSGTLKQKTRRQRLMQTEIEEFRKTEDYKKESDKAARRSLINNIKLKFFPCRNSM